MLRDRGPPFLDFVLVAFLGLLWGLPYALTKISLTSIPPITLTAGRVGLAAVVLWLVVAGRGIAVCLDRDFFYRVFIQGIITCVIPYSLIAVGQRSVDSALAAILNSSTPLFVCIIGICGIRHEAMGAKKLSGAVLGVAGVALVVGLSAKAVSDSALVGQVAILAATACSALSVIHGRRFASLPSELVAAGMLTSGAAVLIPLAAVLEQPWTTTPSVEGLAAMGVNAVGTTSLGFVIYFRLIRTVGSLTTSTTSFLKPLVGVLVGVCLGEAISWWMIIGLVAILLGLTAINGLPPALLALVSDRMRGAVCAARKHIARYSSWAVKLLNEGIRAS